MTIRTNGINYYMLKNFFGNITAFCIGCFFIILLFILFEIGFRYYQKDYEKNMITEPQLIIQSDKGRKINPGIKGKGIITVGKNSKTFLFETDKKGRRVTPQNTNVEKVMNCLFFGCSFTFGTGVNNDQTMPFYFGQLHPECKIYNYGIPGGIPQEMYLLSSNYENFDDIEKKPTFFIYTFISSHLKRLKGTIDIMVRSPYWAGYFPKLSLTENNDIVFEGLLKDINPYLFKFATYTNRYSHMITQTICSIVRDYPDPFTKDNFDLLINLLNKCRENLSLFFPETNLIVFIYPEHCLAPDLQFDSQYFYCPNLKYFTDKLNELNGITVIACDNEEMIGKYLFLSSERKHIILDGHPSPESYKLCAEWISKDLNKLDVIK